MNDLTFPTSALAALTIEGLGMILLPIIVLVLWQKKTHAKLLPVIVGAVTFFVFAVLLKLAPAYLLYYGDNAVSHKLSTTPWLYYLVAGLLAGVFEETGRFIAYKTVLKKYNAPQTCISYGIGHGGFESAVYIGVQMLSMLVMGILVNHGMIGELTKNLSEEQLPVAIEQLSQYAQFTVAAGLLGIFERVSAMMFHTAMSVLVFRAAREGRYLWLYPAAVVLHALIDFGCVIYPSAPVLFEIVFFVCSASALFLAVRLVYRKLPRQEEVSV